MSDMKTDRDNLVLAESYASQDSPSEPFLEKKFIYQLDNNGSSNYLRNEIEFDTSTWSSAGAFINHREGFIIIPFVFHVSSNKNLIGVGKQLDLKIKSDNLHFINSCGIEYNSEPVVQQSPEVSPYLDFLKKTTSSFTDTSLFAHTGFRGNSNEWEFDDHYGLCTTNVNNIPSNFYEATSNKYELYGEKYNYSKCINYVDKTDPLNHYYYYNCYIRLKDLPFMNSMTLTRGARLKLLLTLNQMDITFTNKSGVINHDMNKKGSYCPFMIDKDDMETLLEDANDYLKISCRVGEIDSNHRHVLNQARIYSPAYTLSPTVKKSFENSPQRKLVYNDVFINHIRRVKGNFNYLINPSIPRIKRLIIVPILSTNTASSTNDGNGQIMLDSLDSPFYEAGPVPCNIENFNVSISGLNVYSVNKRFKFETYLDELNCQYGVEGGLENAVSSGVFGLHEYENNQNYIVVDLSRKYDFDEKNTVSIEISGESTGQRYLDFICYVEVEKDFSLDIHTGEKLK